MTNIAKILENTPLGIKLYSPICGECKLEEVMHDFISVSDVNHKEWDFNSDGTCDANGECLLWPSKEHLSWAGWQSLIMRQDECLGTIVMSGVNTPYIITHDGFVLCENVNKCLDTVCAPSIDMRFATIEESEKAMKTLEKENGYKWDENAEELRKIDTPKYYIGDLIVHNSNHLDIRKIVAIEDIENNTCYVCQQLENDYKGRLPIENIDNNYHLWSLLDLQLGDILTDSAGFIFLTDGKTYRNSESGEIDGADFICSIDRHGNFVTRYDFKCYQDNNPWSSENLRPSTYEERQKLFSALSINGYKLCTNNGVITGIEKIKEEPLEVVPTIPEESDTLENASNSAEEKFKEDLKELLMKHNMDQLMSVPADIIVEYMTDNLKNIHTLITKERKAFNEQFKSVEL